MSAVLSPCLPDCRRGNLRLPYLRFFPPRCLDVPRDRTLNRRRFFYFVT